MWEAMTAEDAKDPQNVIYAFEPHPVLARGIASAMRKAPNFHLIQKAVTDQDGLATFRMTQYPLPVLSASSPPT